MKIIVQKYGGSSVATEESREIVSEKIISAIKQDYCVTVILSAMGRAPSPLSTDTLINTACDKTNLSLAEKDLIMATGENYSCIKLSCLLRQKGFKTKVFTGAQAGIITGSQHGNAKIKKIYPKNITEALKEGYIAIIAGFQGMDESGTITTLGRGGSDTTATAIGAALNAQKVEIYTDVDGVMTSDPKIYNEAKIIEALDLSEMGEMANEGAKVLHTRCVEIANKHNLRLFVKNTFSNHEGTKIIKKQKSKNVVSGLIHRTDITDFYTDFSKFKNISDLQKLFLKNMAKLGISLDLININRNIIYFSISDQDRQKTENYLRNSNIPYNIRTNCAKVSCVGIGMKGTPGVMASIFQIMFQEGIKVYRSVDSFINISCLIDGKDLNRAIKALHKLC